MCCFPEGDRLMRVVVGATTETTVEVEWHSSSGQADHSRSIPCSEWC